MTDQVHQTQNDYDLNISEIYDQLQKRPEPPKPPVKTEEFEEIHDVKNENRIRLACILESGDMDFRDNLVFRMHPVAAGLKSFKNNSKIYVDTPLVKEAVLSKISNEQEMRKKEGIEQIPVPEVVCAATHPKAEEFSKKHNLSKAAAGFMLLKNEIKSSIVIIGEDDSALLGVCRLVERGNKPYLILGFPAGFENQKKSKEFLEAEQLETPFILSQGTKGGVAVAAAVAIELMKIWDDEKSVKS
ncbi:precorrin-8X methylmutase [Methanolapillus millepedarum]|uniref:Cobalamin biosynthesis precorrin-8X methylmutase CobH/CbiC domain-containing protein n=1 Tax=Methanolapillus millepedarum TaxID=3028296 RepID=A0AA96ZV94_9EURY|nr:hypothetical protein MsAc7_01140 [Methanosarcinaceae archaeon Ac7]